MANQMIALQARAPQTDFLGNAIQRNAQMMNMMSQQRAAERQAAKAAQEMQLAQAKESREASAAEIEQAGKLIDLYTKRAGQTMNAAGYNLLLRDMEKDSPEIAEAFRANLPPEKFDRNELLKMVGSIGDNFKATYGPLETEVVFDENGNAFVSVTGGFSAEKGTQGMYPLTTRQLKRRPAAPVAGAPAQPSGGIVPAGGFRPTRDVNTTPAGLRAQATPQAVPATPEQLDAAARAVARGANVSDPMLRDLSESDFLEVQKRASRLMQNSPEFQTMSAGGAAQPDLAGIVQTMMDTGVVSQSNLEAMRAAAGPGKDAQLAEILRSNNIRIMPDEQPAGGMRSAVYRPGEGDAGMTRVQALEEYEDTGRQFKGKSPMQSPLPGSSQVPLGRVREEAKAQRKTPQEVYEEKRAEKQADTDVEFLDKYGSARDSAMNTLSVIDQMIGDLNVKDGKIVRGKRAPHPGFESVIGAGIPGLRFIPGTQSADFDALVDQIEGGAFLKAYESLRGTGQITEIEGDKATKALTRMRRSSSEVGFIKAAREFEGIIRRGMERAEQRKARLEGGSASRPAPRSETKRGANIDDLLRKYGG